VEEGVFQKGPYSIYEKVIKQLNKEEGMNPIKSLMGRRQFLIAAGVASTCALTCKRLAGFEARTAMAAELSGTASIKGAGNRCPHLLSPLRIRNKVLKNRIIHTQSPNFTMQGPENYPGETLRNHNLNLAKNAAIVTMNTMFGGYPKKYITKADGYEDWLYEAVYSWQHIGNDKWENIPPVWNYVERMIDDIHTEGSLILCSSTPGNVATGSGSVISVGLVRYQARMASLHAQGTGSITKNAGRQWQDRRRYARTGFPEYCGYSKKCEGI